MAVGQSYESLTAGRFLGQIDLRITTDDIRGLTFANLGTELNSDADLAAQLRPSLVLALGLRAIMRLDVIPPGGVLVGHRLTLREPFRLDDELSVDVLVDRAWSSRGRPFATVGITFLRGGSSICIDEMTAIWPMDQPVALQRLPKIASRTESDLSVSQKQVERYAEVSEDRNPLHLDELFARSGPFGELVVHGVIPAGVMLDEWAATHPQALADKPLRLGFLSPLRPAEGFAIELDGADGPSRAVTTSDQRVIATLTPEQAA